MPFENLALVRLIVNRANDRHGELENETAAIAELFRLREAHMRNLATDIARESGIYEPPLVWQDGEDYLVFDGNRRVTCLKLIASPGRAPTQELQTFFQTLHDDWRGDLPSEVMCQIEEDRDRIDAILYRRHTGSQGGVGQSDWDDRAKRNFIERTGRGGRIDVAAEIEDILQIEQRLPAQTIPRSTLNRLLSSEENRRRVGISVAGNSFRITHERERVLDALSRIAGDLAAREIVLGDLWNNEGKRAYLNRLDAEGLLPQEAHVISPEPRPDRRPPGGRRPGRPPARPQSSCMIPSDAPLVPWNASQARVRAIWEELQSLSLALYPNAVSALTRILLELAVEGYLRNQNLYRPNETLSDHVRRAAEDLRRRGIIDDEYLAELNRLRQHDELISLRSMQRYVHSPTFAPLPRELEAYWVRLGRFVVACLDH